MKLIQKVGASKKSQKTIAFLQLFILISLRFFRLIFWKKFFCKDIYVKRWFGDLGNNLIQITHIKYLSEQIRSPFYLPQHKFLEIEKNYPIHSLVPEEITYKDSSTSTLLLNDLKTHVKNITKSHRFSILRSFYYQYDVSPFTLNLADYRRILKNQIFPLIPCQEGFLVSSVNDDTLVIHIRSGDIFNDHGVHDAYIQPPVSFYEKIINEFNFKDVLIVTQKDLRNPCIARLKELFPNIRIQASSLLEDVNTILNARNLVTAMSTFSLSLGFASNKIKRLYVPQFQVKRGYWRTFFWPAIFQLLFNSKHTEKMSQNLDFELYLLDILNYIEIGNWKNTQEQRDQMINHLCEHVLYK